MLQNITKKLGSLTKKITIILLTFTVAAFFCPAVNVLEVCNRKNTLQHYYSKQALRKGFVISYTHSVNKGRVHDYYKVTNKNERNAKGNDLELYKTEFVSYGAGIPEPEEITGAIFSVDGNTYTISNINRKMKQLVMAVGLIANHTISFGNSEEIKLTDYFPAQTSIIIKIKKISLASFLFGKKIGVKSER